MKVDNNINQLSFNGLFLKAATHQSRMHCARSLANITHLKTNDIFEMTDKATNKKLSFLKILGDKYNAVNFYKPENEKEAPEIINKIYNSIQNPNRSHFTLLNNFYGNMTKFLKIVEGINNRQSRLDFAIRFNREITANYKEAENILPELLNSPNVNDYIRNYEQYKPYLILNCKEKDAVQNLDYMIETRTYNPSTYSSRLNESNLAHYFKTTQNEIFNEKVFALHYTPSAEKILSTIMKHYRLTQELLDDGAAQIILEIFKTTTPQNLGFRREILHAYSNSKNSAKDELTGINNLFKKTDKDKHAKEFVTYLINRDLNLSSSAQINAILENISCLKLSIFKKNAVNILKQIKEDEKQIQTLSAEIENPFFETELCKKSRLRDEQYGFKAKKSAWDKYHVQIKNQIKKIQYKILSFIEENKSKETVLHPEKPATVSQKTQNAEVKPALTSAPKEANIEKNVPSISTEITLPLTETKETTEKKAEKILPIKKATKQEKKAEIAKNIIEIIQSKLGTKTFARQQEAYGNQATKIRLSLLPEIFSSVADTRKADRAVGKHKINSSNKDVLELYSLINGNNKKFVNYLLKKRNIDNTRMFEVKDIINQIKKAESRIAENKKNNPEYRARDARRYYNHLHQAKIEQYGKLSRKKPIN